MLFSVEKTRVKPGTVLIETVLSGDFRYQSINLSFDAEVAEKFLLGHYCLVVLPLLFFCIIKT